MSIDLRKIPFNSVLLFLRVKFSVFFKLSFSTSNGLENSSFFRITKSTHTASWMYWSINLFLYRWCICTTFSGSNFSERRWQTKPWHKVSHRLTPTTAICPLQPGTGRGAATRRPRRDVIAQDQSVPCLDGLLETSLKRYTCPCNAVLGFKSFVTWPPCLHVYITEDFDENRVTFVLRVHVHYTWEINLPERGGLTSSFRILPALRKEAPFSN